MKLSGLLWMWREKSADDLGGSDVSYRPTSRQWWHWLVLFAPACGLLLIWLPFQRFATHAPAAVRAAVHTYLMPAFSVSCFVLGFWWRRRWVGDRFGHGIMAGFAILAFNYGALFLCWCMLLTYFLLS